jgi:DNA-binding NtrC family response regulator
LSKLPDLKLLIVDDEEEFLERLVERFERRGIDVQGVTTGEEALETIENHSVDVILLDIRLPGIDGVQVLQRVKKRHPFVEVILFTGYADAKTAVRVMELGAFDYLLKPIPLDDLLYRIQDAYKRKTLREAAGDDPPAH